MASAAMYCRIRRDGGGLGLGVSRQEELCGKLAAEKVGPVAEMRSLGLWQPRIVAKR